MLFFLLIKVEMPTIVGISTFMSRKNFEHVKSFKTWGPDHSVQCLPFHLHLLTALLHSKTKLLKFLYNLGYCFGNANF